MIGIIGASEESLNWGGKASNLNLLTRKNINVPKGLVLSSELYDKYQATHELSENDLSDIQKSLKEIGASAYMVRSSAIGEDGIDNSFAGQLDSFQSSSDIEEIKSNIIKCWESAQSDRVLVYQETNKIKLGGMAVVIQELVNPDYAGVLFTTSPIIF